MSEGEALLDKLGKNPQDVMRRERSEGSRGEIKAFLGEGTSFKGVLAFEGTVRIDGKLEGEIITEDTLIIGEKAVVNAEINAGSVAISGKVTGDITAKERIDIHSTGEVYGNIQTPILTIEEGVIFQGNCNMHSRIEGRKGTPKPLEEKPKEKKELEQASNILLDQEGKAPK